MAFDVIIQVDGSTDDDLTAAASMVEVQESIGEPTTYRIEVPLVDEGGDFPLLLDARVGAGSDITIATAVNDKADVLCIGQVYGQKLLLQNGVRESQVQVIGGDRMFEMDRAIVNKVWTGVKVSDVIESILGPYVDEVAVDPIESKHDEKTHELVQVDTDLRFVRRLARRYGHWFRVAADQDAKTKAYFQRPRLDGEAVATLSINKGNDSTLAELEIEWDIERPAAVKGNQLPLRNKHAFTGDLQQSPLTPLGALAFADIASNRKEVRLVAPMDDAGDFKPRSEAALIEGSWFVKARGQVSARALGAVLHAHAVVKLDGAGTRYSGKYVVAAVRHVFDDHDHVMHFELIRNAWEA